MSNHPAEIAAEAVETRQSEFVKNAVARRERADKAAGASEESAPAASRPSNSASKAEWVAYAESLGYEDADEYTKGDLIAAIDSEN